MSGFADLYYVAWRRAKSKSDHRTDGYFLIPSRSFACDACSGSSHLYPVPAGRYLANNFRDRTEKPMFRDGVGFSVDLSDKYDPAVKRMRSLMRIHPDGNVPGTAGCVGILSDVAACRDHLKAMLPSAAASLSLLVVLSPDDQAIDLVMSLVGGVLSD